MASVRLTPWLTLAALAFALLSTAAAGTVAMLPDKVAPAVPDRQDFISPDRVQLTGEARFAEQLERVVLNQLLGAQQPDCTAWGYYVQMEGRKPYSASFDGHCCLSSGPRGRALIPTFAVSTDAEGLDAINDDNPRSIAIVGPAPAERSVWFAVSLPAPAPVRRIAFVPGPPKRNTGWFDAASGRPRAEILRQPGDRGEPVGELADYPATAATDSAGLERGRRFELSRPHPFRSPPCA